MTTLERSSMETHPVVSREEWLSARKAFLAREKEFTRLRDAVSRQRRELPWVKVEKAYQLEGRDGPKTLIELFRAEKDPVMKKAIVQQLSVMDDPDATRAILDVLGDKP